MAGDLFFSDLSEAVPREDVQRGRARCACLVIMDHVVIVGGGFGGLSTARSLRKVPVRLTLLDRRNFHLFQPLLYQVATGWLSPANIASTLRATLRHQKNASVLLADAKDFDIATRRVLLDDGEIHTTLSSLRPDQARTISAMIVGRAMRRDSKQSKTPQKSADES